MTSFATDNSLALLTMYEKQSMSIYAIAEKMKVAPSKVRRALVKLGVKMRDKSESTKLAMSQGRLDHPTKGKKHSAATKQKISEASAEEWANMPDERRALISKKHQKAWNARSKASRDAQQKKAVEGNLKAAKVGSKLEHELLQELTKAGYRVIHHHRGLVDAKLEVDFFLPELSLAIELDGPSHFLPIYSQEKLDKTIASDQKKNGQLVNAGIRVIRLCNRNKAVSDFRKRQLMEALVSTLEKIRAGKISKKFIEIDV